MSLLVKGFGNLKSDSRNFATAFGLDLFHLAPYCAHVDGLAPVGAGAAFFGGVVDVAVAGGE